MPGPGDFIKDNIKQSTAGKVGKAFIAYDIANLAASNNKLKAMLDLLKDILLLRPIMAAGFAGMFFAMSKAIRTLVADTGSLDAALKKLSQIQGLQKMFTGILGGAAAAKLKVAELVNFAATRNIKLGDAAEASRSLLLMTKGGFSSARALDVVNDAAKATGNSVVGMADAVGEFIATIQGGGSIEQATEKLRQMGVINDTTAETFMRLQKNGASAGQVIGVLTTTLEGFKGGAEEAAQSIEGVNEAYEKAVTNLQEKFGSPFVEDNVRDTKNYADAMNAVAPAVGRVSKFMNGLTGGISNAKSTVVSFIASSNLFRTALEGLAYALTALVSVASILGASSLSGFFTGLSKSIGGLTYDTILGSKGMNSLGQAMSAAGVSGKTTEAILTRTSATMVKLQGAASLLSRALSLIPAVTVGLAIGSAVYKWIASFEAAAIALQEVQKGQNQSNEETRKQIQNIHTLAQKHDAVTNALKKELDARIALTAAEKDGNQAGIEAAESNLAVAKALREKAVASKAAGPTEEEKELDRVETARAREEKAARFQAELGAAKPAEQAAMRAKNLEDIRGKIRRGERGEGAVASFSRANTEADTAVKVAEADLEVAKLEKKSAEARLKAVPTITKGFGTMKYTVPDVEKEAAVQAEIDKAGLMIQQRTEKLGFAKQQQATVGATAPTGTSTELRARLREKQLSTDKGAAQEAFYIERELEKALQEEKETGANKILLIQEKAALNAMAREKNLYQLGLQRELDIQKAQISGDTAALERAEELNVFIEKYREARDQGLTEPEAKKAAGEFADNALTLSTQGDIAQGVQGTVADSLTRIGGGGGVYAPSGDPMMTIAQKQVALHQEELTYLKKMSEAEAKGKVL